MFTVLEANQVACKLTEVLTEGFIVLALVHLSLQKVWPVLEAIRLYHGQVIRQFLQLLFIQMMILLVLEVFCSPHLHSEIDSGP